ncbi:3-hydroxyacyl-CoA dehydrogenase [Aromatoleum aromaticum]|uniref:3-hydroxyacyl-CoA dehydrogenase n=1 Tax=Aromatoleum aromaticum (strain DSM 19018 / LMG 30748 / EbN1) TaxID=76114 RepID=Q5P039_AROAE|nr:3-hydroxyacyl-CoA dehydrogenase [Aromatoleum aromaticum]NMG54861.1 3-hydroxyacyl-CoA dehydrogenase [Aromatoleum aromaticum]CAI09325.1 3-hydroxyacyl-CoA dehydrogenase [Aromatoleum aromaticum EbN1]
MTTIASVSDAAREQALAYVDGARRDAARIPDIPADTPLRPIRRVGVIGAGTMGGGIAMSFANVGIPVTVCDTDGAALERGLERVRRNYEFSVARGRLDAATMAARLALIRAAVDLQDLKDADLVIEAVFEDMALKQDIFRKLDAIVHPDAILATNTSGLDIDEIAVVTRRPQDVVGAHFFSPAHVQKLLEVVRGARTAPEVIATLMSLGRRMGKVSVLSRIYPGFIGNALFRQYVREAHFLVEEGALPHEVDSALGRFGYAMGVFAVHDMAGNDVGWQMRKAQMATRPRDRRWNDLILELCDMGRLGQKSGKGWYRYENGDRTPRRDPEIERYIVERSAHLGIERRPIGEDEIIKRCLYGMINEGAKLLEQGIALRASDIDIVFVTGYGFPAERGGPMYYADQVGLAGIFADVKQFHTRHGAWWTPSPLLERLAASGKKFAEL